MTAMEALVLFLLGKVPDLNAWWRGEAARQSWDYAEQGL